MEEDEERRTGTTARLTTTVEAVAAGVEVEVEAAEEEEDEAEWKPWTSLLSGRGGRGQLLEKQRDKGRNDARHQGIKLASEDEADGNDREDAEDV